MSSNTNGTNGNKGGCQTNRKASLPDPEHSVSVLDAEEQPTKVSGKTRSSLGAADDTASIRTAELIPPQQQHHQELGTSFSAPASPTTTTGATSASTSKKWSLGALLGRRKKSTNSVSVSDDESVVSDADSTEQISPSFPVSNVVQPVGDISAQFRNFFSKRSSFDENLDWTDTGEGADDEGPWRPPASWASQVDLPKSLPPIQETVTMQGSPRPGGEEEFWAIRVFKPMDRCDARIQSSLVENSGHTFVTVACSLSTTAAELCRILAKKFSSTKDLERFRLFVIHSGTERLLAHEDRPVAMLKNWLEVIGYRDGDQLQKIAREDHSYLCRFVFHEFPPAPPSSEEYERGAHPRITSRSAFLAEENLSVIPVAVFKNAATLEFMDLSRNTLLDVPDDLFEGLTNLRLLRLIGNQLTAVPRAIIKTQLLTHLDLSSNNLTGHTLDVLRHCPLLTHLNLACNQIDAFPDSLACLTKMRALDLSSNYLAAFPEAILEMSELKELNLAFNLLRVVPDAIENLKVLRVLSLTGNSIHHIPHSICELIHLRQLNIQGNLMESLGGIAWIASASEIALSYNNIKALTTSAWNSATQVLASHNQLNAITFQQVLPFLRVLNLRVNQLIELPESLFEFTPALESLNLERNLLTRLPTSINGLQYLESLQLADNEISDFGLDFIGLTRLAHVDARGNNIKQLPGSIWKAPALKTLNLSSNIISGFPEPPFYISSPPLAESLEELYLAENVLTDVAMDEIYLLTKLTVLNISHNQIFDLGDDIGRLANLTDLFVSGNGISRIPESIEHLQRLKAFFINGNKLSNIPSELAKIATLEAFDASNNNLRFNVANWPYDWNWNYNPELQYLNLSNNRKFELMPAQENPSEKVKALTSFKALTKLRLLILNGLKDSKNIPDESISLRVRRSHFDDYFRVGVVEYCGRDMVFDKFEASNRNFLDLDNDYMLGFFDGYGSDVVSYYLKDSLAEAIMYEVQRLSGDEDLAAALRRGFLTCNRDLSMPSTQIVVGASATVLYLLEDRLYIASVGDSIAVISREGQAIVANEKHHCWNRSEQSRIRNLGGNISTDGLVERELAITRGFGFHHLLPYVNANPFIGSFKVADDGKDEFVIVASQSFWKFVRYQVAVDIARTLRETPELAVVRLRDTALAYGATKSLSVMMLCLNKLGSRGPHLSGATGAAAAAAVSSTPGEAVVEKRRKVRGSVEDRTLARLEAEIPPPKPPCAIVFTDIRESTKLWEKDPNAMRAANKLHNQLLRRLLRHYRGYEVKNEGDAFMVVFETVGDAVRWGMSVQEHLLEADWPQEILNNPIASPVAGPDGRLLYRGLSVRMGVHYGMAISEQDIVTHRMDYFGVDVITASRICDAALGGQLIITSTVHRMLLAESKGGEEAMEAQPGVVDGMAFFEIGATKLKGIENFELVYAVYPESLAARFTTHLPKI